MALLKKLWQAWNAAAAKLGAALAWLVLVLLHLAVVTPLAMAYRALRRDPKPAGSNWRTPPPQAAGLDDARGQG
jgi:hypothetical protein